MREFKDRDGAWRVWRVHPEGDAAPLLAEAYRGGWLCFEATESGKRWRLPLAQANAQWEEGSDIQLRQLLSSARKGAPAGVTTKKVAEQRRVVEDAARG